MGGSPRLLRGHPSVTMTAEVIRIAVGAEKVTVDCRFTFTNHGPACVVRMGFPDEGYGADDPDEEEDAHKVMKLPARTTFTSFRSTVDGKPVPTKLIRADQEGHYWHTKMVSFPANGIRNVHDVYTLAPGGGIVEMNGKVMYAAQIGYILHTGASWHGNIGSSEVYVTFLKGTVRGPLRAVRHVRGRKPGDERRFSVPGFTNGTIVWDGPAAPTVKGDTLRFVRHAWRPREADDIVLAYGWRGADSP